MTKRARKRQSGRTRRNGAHAAHMKSLLSVNGSAHRASGNGSGIFARCAQAAAHWTGKPVTFLIALGLIVVWAVTGPIFGYSDTWQLVVNTATTIVTFLMVFLIQNTQNRDNGALHAKLDELIRAVADADNEYIGIEHLTDQELKVILQKVEKNAHRLYEERQRRRGESDIKAPAKPSSRQSGSAGRKKPVAKTKA